MRRLAELGFRERSGLVLAPLAFLGAGFGLTGSLDFEPRWALAVALVMAVLWITESIPLWLTALLPLLLFPLVVPAMLASVRATALVLEGDPMTQLPSWVGLLAAFNGVYWSLCGLLFGRVVED